MRDCFQGFDNRYSQRLTERIGALDFHGEALFVELLDGIVQMGVTCRASDISLEPLKTHLLVKYRIDGILYPVLRLKKELEEPLLTRIKVVTKLVIYQHRQPQEGRFHDTARFGGIDLRVSIIPTLHGEKTVVRIHYSDQSVLPVEQLGFLPAQLERIRRIVAQPQGLVLFTGPAGSGKSTTIYSLLKYLHTAKGKFVNLCTIEDPVEVDLQCLPQTSIDEPIGFTYSSGLKTILRHDPNIIMVGEIRDRETARLTIEAALTGHLIISTMHSKSAAGVIIRLLNMELEPYLVASALTAVLAQRLVRKVCPACGKEERLADQGWVEKYGLTTQTRGRGCEQCNLTGYLGREALFEVREIDDQLADLILRKSSLGELENRWREPSALSLPAAGVEKVKRGVTTMDELLRVL